MDLKSTTEGSVSKVNPQMSQDLSLESWAVIFVLLSDDEHTGQPRKRGLQGETAGSTEDGEEKDPLNQWASRYHHSYHSSGFYPNSLLRSVTS